jgi:hypothetical protein
MANDEHVVRFLGGDVNPDARQWRYDAADVVATEEHDARTVVPYQSLDVVGEFGLGGKLAESFEFERRRRCERPYLFAKTRDDFDVVLFVLTDPSLLSCVSFSLRDDDYGRDPFVECGAVLDGPDESGFRKLRSINGTTNVIRSVSTPLAITPRGGYGTPRRNSHRRPWTNALRALRLSSADGQYGRRCSAEDALRDASEQLPV